MYQVQTHINTSQKTPRVRLRWKQESFYIHRFYIWDPIQGTFAERKQPVWVVSEQLNTSIPHRINDGLHFPMVLLLPLQEHRYSRNARHQQPLAQDLPNLCRCCNVPGGLHGWPQQLLLRACWWCNCCRWGVDDLCTHILVREMHPQNVRLQVVGDFGRSDWWWDHHSWFCSCLKFQQKLDLTSDIIWLKQLDNTSGDNFMHPYKLNELHIQ